MSRLIRLILALALAGAALTAAIAQHYYDPDESGHGLTVQSVGDRYVAQWYFHDGEQTRWIASDVCHYGDPCEVWTVSASGFPAGNADLVEAGEIVIDQTGGGVLLTYDLEIEHIGCWTLPGPLPPQCRDEHGNQDPSLIYQRGFAAAGSAEMEVLVE